MRQILLGIILHSALGGTNLKNLAMVTGVDMDKINQEQDQELGLKVYSMVSIKRPYLLVDHWISFGKTVKGPKVTVA